MTEEAATLFAGPAQASELKQQQEQQAELNEQIDRLKMELEWLKKSCRVLVSRSVSKSIRIIMNLACGDRV